MVVRINEVIDAFEFLFENLHDRDFRKTLPLNAMGERELLPLVRTYLLGFFWQVGPEARSKLSGTLSGYGSIDFIVGNVAVEFAVRRPLDPKRALSRVTNSTEIKKLIQHRGPSLLVLFDFSKSPFQKSDLERYREWTSLGKGNHDRSAFNVAYFFRRRISRSFECHCMKMNIRV